MEFDSLVKTVINARRSAGLTQAELADRARLSRRTIIDFESGKSDLGIRRLMRILLALNLALSIGPASERPIESELRDIFKDDDE
ncbi:MAG: helix-turn-helix transcriptional regulator [Pseudomonadota bacterium]